MPEILTESFCERCGTRYTFESATPRGPRLKGLKVVSRGLKNFVLSDDTSMDEAMAAARSETDREVTSHQLDAFHKTFSFCMNCRQYTCGNCWNEVEGRCLSCSPHLGQEILPAPFPNLPGSAIGANSANGHVANGQNGHEDLPRLDPLAWPASDLMADEDLPAAVMAIDDVVAEPEPIDDIASAVDASESVLPEAVPVVDPAPIEPAISLAADPPAVLAHESPAEPAADWPPSPVGVDDRAAVAATRTADLLHRFRPGQSLDEEIDAFERDKAAADEPPTPMPAAAAEPEPAPIAPAEAQAEPEPVAAAEPEPVAAAEAQAEPEPVAAAEPEPAPVAAAEPEPVTEPEPRHDVVAQPTWQIIAPDSPTADGVPASTVPSAPQPPTQPIAASAEPQWPTKPEWPSQRPASSLPFLGRPVAPTGGIEALWAESAREVAAAAGTAPVTARATSGVQPCVSCGLSLSANARFCRRCGSRQG